MTIDLPITRHAVNPLLILLTASTGCATVLDTNVVAIVLPTIARDLGASFAEVEWVVSTYVLCFASLLLPAGAIADRFGRRRVSSLKRWCVGLDQRHNKSERRMDCASNNGSIPLERGSALHDPGP
jgi:Major Facilitator Superfamily